MAQSPESLSGQRRSSAPVIMLSTPEKISQNMEPQLLSIEIPPALGPIRRHVPQSQASQSSLSACAAVRPSLAATQAPKYLRKVGFALGIAMFVTLGCLVANVVDPDAVPTRVHTAGLAALLFTEATTLAAALTVKKVPATLVLWFVGGVTVAVLLLDLAQRAMLRPAGCWYIIVAAMPLLAAFDAPSAAPAVVGGLCGLWVVLMALESTLRLGLFTLDIPRQSFVDLVACDAPPCAAGAQQGLFEVATGLAVVAAGVAAWRERVGVATQRTQRWVSSPVGDPLLASVLKHMVSLDFDTSRSLLRDSALFLPVEVANATEAVIDTLEKMMTYVPDIVVADICGAGDTPRESVAASLVAPPATENDSVIAMLFTDVRSSTQLWMKCPDGMKKSLRLHNICIRNQLAIHEGYEVKTIGDAFMAAFKTSKLALKCGLAIQNELPDLDWPLSLLARPECKPDEFNLWGGLVLRMGVDSGPVDAEWNEVTGRWDYFGDTVNRASRLEACCPSGAVNARTEVMKAAQDELDINVELCLRQFDVQLKGFGKSMVSCTAVVPWGLEGRWQLSHDQWVRQQPDPSPTFSCAGSVLSGSSTLGRQRMNVPVAQLATVAALQIADEFSAITTADFLHLRSVYEAICQCVQATGGVIISVLNHLVIVAWTDLRGHREASAHFVSLYRKRCLKNSRAYMGLSSGPLLVWMAGTDKQQHLTAAGDCIHFAVYLANQALRTKIMNLYGGPSDASIIPRNIVSVTLQRHSEIEYDWEGSMRLMAIFEICVEGWHRFVTSVPQKHNSDSSFKCTSVTVTGGLQHALDQVYDDLAENVSMLCVYSSSSEVIEQIASLCLADERFVDTVVHGCTSAVGSLSNRSADCEATVFFGIHDPSGFYISAIGHVNADGPQHNAWRNVGIDIATEAYDLAPSFLKASAKPLILLHCTPGHEEAVIDGIHDVIPTADVFGGSAGDTAFDPSAWRVVSGGLTLPAPAVSLTLMWPTVPYTLSLNSLHDMDAGRNRTAEVTEVAEDGRRLVSLDGKPARDVYDAWTKFNEDAETEEQLSSRSTLRPLARLVQSDDTSGIFTLHPMMDRADDRSMGLFASAKVGERLVCTSSNRTRLVNAVSDAAERTQRRALLSRTHGAIAIYCAGCAFELERGGKGNVSKVGEAIMDALEPGTPFASAFTFGEQGPGIDGKSLTMHANLMFNLLVFGETAATSKDAVRSSPALQEQKKNNNNKNNEQKVKSPGELETIEI